jgi:general secretion pathway protein B
MSFILDALKKSEDERLGQTGPNLAYAPTGSRREGIPRWVLVLSVLLLINLAGLIALMSWRQPAPETGAFQLPPQEISIQEPAVRKAPIDKTAVDTTPPSETQPAAEVATTTPEVAGAELPATGQRSAADQADVRSLEYEAGTKPTRQLPTQTVDDPGNQAAQPAVTATADPAPGIQEPGKSQERVPTLNELLGEGRLMNLQSLGLDLHVYAARREDRFVFINLGKYREGQQLKEGPMVDEITPQGVILRYQGVRFLLPRT